VKSNLDTILSKRKILITCGTGGVGKTTLSAAIAVRAALLGRRVIVVTIDPAKRLATSLGLSNLSDQPTDLTPFVTQAWGGEIKGSLAALMPDTRKTFENFAHDLAPNPVLAEKLIQNPIFQIFAREFSGTNEYMALERLLAIHKKGEYDCIILDTPPSRNTLAFLEAPHILAALFDEKIFRWLVLPANRIFSAGMKKALGILEKLTGEGFMTQLFDFASALLSVQVNFKANLKKITSLLESSDVGFLMVSAPTPEASPEVNLFLNKLEEHNFHFDGVILNRTLSYFELNEPPSEGFEPAYQILQAIQEREKAVVHNLLRNPIPVCAKLPELARDVHSVEDLVHVAMAFGAIESHHPDL
jgi:anion-transporting  ArsA/GET3 family ATPase